MERSAWIVAIVVVLLSAAPPHGAAAGEYHVYSCRTPSGAPAPTEGWTGSVVGIDAFVRNTCQDLDGALTAALGDQVSRSATTAGATWSFGAPPDETLAAATLWRAGDVSGGSSLEASYEIGIAAPAESTLFDQCISGLGCVGVGEPGRPISDLDGISVPPANIGSRIYLRAWCEGNAEYECPANKGDENNYAAALYLYAADLTLEQTLGPSVSSVGGELASAAAVSGTSDVTFDAADPGSGVYEAVFSVDGSVVQSTVIDEAGGHCRNVGQTTDGLPAFLYLQPCPSSVSADVGFDTTHVANGTHHLLVTVIDPAGNAAPVLDRTITVANPGAPGPPNGVGATADAHLAARWSSTPHARLTTRFGRRETIFGRLTGEHGQPISGAQLQLTETPALAGAHVTARSSVETNAAGGFEIRLPAGLSSRTIRLSYSARLDEATPVATQTLLLAVHAPVWLTIEPRTAGAGTTIHFHGRLTAGPIPPGGMPLILEARSEGGAWIEFDVLRSDAHGRFKARYTFRFPGPVTYQFRALCEQEADYPYATGASPSVSVWER